MKKFILMIFAGLLLASCEQQPVSGFVVGKKHIPEHNTIHYNHVLHMNQVQHVQEQWVVFVADSNHVHPCHVTPETYERLEKGQFVTAKGFE